tara:strand:- start:368 stop:625 length:258 start_codon:yes stop_codon:yes gene_type:complete
MITTLKDGSTVTSLKNGLIISQDEDGFESFNHLTLKIDKGSFTEFKGLPDMFYKELRDDDRTLLGNLAYNNADVVLSEILERTRT